MSVFHRVPAGQSRELPGPLYFMLANRLGAYAGVMQARIAKRQQDEKEGRYPEPSGSRGASSSSAARAEVSDTFMLEKLANEGWVEKG